MKDIKNDGIITTVNFTPIYHTHRHTFVPMMPRTNPGQASHHITSPMIIFHAETRLLSLPSSHKHTPTIKSAQLSSARSHQSRVLEKREKVPPSTLGRFVVSRDIVRNTWADSFAEEGQGGFCGSRKVLSGPWRRARRCCRIRDRRRRWLGCRRRDH